MSRYTSSKQYPGVQYYIKKNGDKSYRIRYINPITKKQVQKQIGLKSEGVTEKYCRTKLEELSRNKNLNIEEIKLDEAADLMYKYKTLNKRNDKNKQLYTKHISPDLGIFYLSKINNLHLKNLQLKKLEEKFSNKYVNDIIAEIRVIMNWSIEQKKFFGENPVIKFLKKEKLKIDNERVRYLSILEINKLLKSVENNQQLNLFVNIALRTGARLNAICSLQKKDININKKTITLFDEKTNEIYTIPIENQDFLTLLKNRIENLYNEQMLILGFRDNNTVARINKQIYDKLTRHLKQFNAKNVTTKDKVVIHTLRHTFASQLAINGVSIFTIKELMHHSSIEMTMRYAKLNQTTKIEALNKLKF